MNSLGRWVPVHDEEWDGDIPVSRTVTPESDDDCGEVVFKASTVPWEVGTYEVRGTCFAMLLDRTLSGFAT